MKIKVLKWKQNPGSRLGLLFICSILIFVYFFLIWNHSRAFLTLNILATGRVTYLDHHMQQSIPKFYEYLNQYIYIWTSLVCFFVIGIFVRKDLIKIQENWWMKVSELVVGSREQDIGLENHFSKNRKSKDYVPTY